MTHLPPLPDAASAPYPPHPAPITEEQKEASREAAEKPVAEAASLQAAETRRKRAAIAVMGLGSTVIIGATLLGARLYSRFARTAPAAQRPRKRSGADDKRQRGGPDRVRVAADEPYEVRYFARKHGISAAAAREIITQAGPDRKAANALALARK
ncbi:DUF3606 domain-containing protein [Sphingomonas sp. JC676]|uniref:DUF3606 domain-containing protein n=1 Tax=Sphingomonas sp. JC676 TaxID=2768065 RepID=UPI00223B5A36|nr:DUF3606 domain-containing protein [Sphingomonas sp. JC676]